MKQNKRIKAVFFDLGNTLVSSNEFMENKALNLTSPHNQE